MMRSMRYFFGSTAVTLLLLGCAAEKLHRQGLADVERGNYETGVAQLAQAVDRDPKNLTYRLDLAARREAAIEKLVSNGDAARDAGQLDLAVATYKRVLTIDSANSRAVHGIEGVDADRRHGLAVAEAVKDYQRKDYDSAETKLRVVLSEDAGFGPAKELAGKITMARGPTTVAPQLKTRSNGRVTLQFRDAPTKMVFEVLARQTGINFILDKDVKSDGKTTIFVQDVPIEEAIDLVINQNSLARQILSSNMVLIYPNTPTKQKDYEEQIVHTFYLTNAAPKDVENLLKSMLGAKTLFVDERTNVVVMRDSPDLIRMAEKLVSSIDVPEPEVLIEVEVLEIARSKILNLGVGYPSAVTLTPSSVVGAAGSSGGLVLADLNRQNSNTIGVSSLSATVNASQQRTDTNTLASPRIRTRNKEKAKILIGSRVPVITNSVTPTATSAVVTGSVQYLDVGLTLEVQPTIYLDGDVAIKIGLEVSSIINQVTTPSGTVAYTIGTRNANTVLRLKDGETQVLAGLIQDSDTRGATGIPGFSQLPIIGRLFGAHNSDREKSEIVLSITPRIIRTQARAGNDAQEFWYGTETRTRTTPFHMSDSDASGSAAMGSGTVGGPGAISSAPGTAVGQRAGAMAAATPMVLPSTTALAVPGTAPSVAGNPTAPTGPVPHPTVTIDGPTETTVGQEFDVTVRVASETGISRLRGQVRFDGSAVQLVSASAGDLVPASAGSPNVDAKSGGAQLDVISADDPIQGDGSLMILHFKALSARAESAIVAQVSALTPSGGSMANAASQPLNVAIKP